LARIPDNAPDVPFTEPTPAMDKKYVVDNDSIASYRNYYNGAKTHLASWKGKINSRNVPIWFKHENLHNL
jgi:hypothetical protein